MGDFNKQSLQTALRLDGDNGLRDRFKHRRGGDMSLAIKFTTLLARTLAKPIANSIKANAQEYPKFRRICIKIAQNVHKADVNLRLRLLNEQDIKVRPLNDAKAIQTGANFLAESFIFSVGGAAIFYEAWRSRRKEQKRQASVEDDIRVLQEEIDWLKQKLKKDIDADDFVASQDVQPTVLKVNKSTDKSKATDKASDKANDKVSEIASVKASNSAGDNSSDPETSKKQT